MFDSEKSVSFAERNTLLSFTSFFVHVLLEKKNYKLPLGILLPTVLDRKYDLLSVSAIKKGCFPSTFLDIVY